MPASVMYNSVTQRDSSHAKPVYSHQHLFANGIVGHAGHHHTAFPFPPSPIFLSSLLHHQSSVSASLPQSWFIPPPPPLAAQPLSLTASDTKHSPSTAGEKSAFRESPPREHMSGSPGDQRSLGESGGESAPNGASISMAGDHQERGGGGLTNSVRQHSDNLSWLADVASSLPSGLSSGSPSTTTAMPLSLSHSVSSQRSLYSSTMGSDLYSPRFGSTSGSPSLFHYQTGSSVGPPAAHFTPPFIASYNAYQQYSPTAQTVISPFVVPNTTSVATTRNNGTYGQTGIDSYHHNSSGNTATNNHSNNAMPTAVAASQKSSSIASHSGLTINPLHSPSIHSSDSSSLLSSGPFSSPPLCSDSAEDSKSLVRLSKESLHSPNENSVRSGDPSDSSPTAASPAVKRKSITSPEPTSVYKLPWGKEGSRKHRILKPPNISIIESRHTDSPPNHHLLSGAPLSAPPIAGARRHQHFAKRMSTSEISPLSHPFSEPVRPKTVSFQRRRSMPQTTSTTATSPACHKSLTSLESVGKSVSRDAVVRSVSANENVESREQQQSHLQYPVYFQKGSIIQLGNGKVKPVEEMSTQDFIDSATQSPDLCADCSEVMKVEDKIRSCSVLLSFFVGRARVPVTVEAPVEHPFFVFHKGWSSCSPERSFQRYGLKCRKLKVGDICVSLTPKPPQSCSASGEPPKRRDSHHISDVNNNDKLAVNHDPINSTADTNSAPVDQSSSGASAQSGSVGANAGDGSASRADPRHGKVETSVPTSPTKRCRRHSAPDVTVAAFKNLVKIS